MDNSQTSKPGDSFVQALNSTSSSGTVSIPSKHPRKIAKILLGLGVVVLLVLSIVGITGFFVYTKAHALLADVKDLQSAGKDAYAALKSQNLVEADAKFSILQTKMQVTQAQYKQLSWMGKLPIISPYYLDGIHAFNAGFAALDAAQKLIKAIEPYADVLGFKGQGSFSGGSAQDRIAKIIGTLGKVTPEIDVVASDLHTVGAELAFIDEKRYPEEFRSIKVRSLILQAKDFSGSASQLIVQAKPMIEVLPDIAGGNGRKKYLVLFQNSGELRPTGGFMTGYAILNIENGKIEPEASGDIYDLDLHFKNKPPIPPILGKFLTTETKWNLRDMNVSPDFKTSMDTFFKYYETVPGQPVNVDGIIAVDTHFLESLVKVLGPVDVPTYGTFSAATDKRCNCPQIIYALSEIIDRPTPYLRPNRKGILGPMMKSVLEKAYGAPKQSWPDLFSTGWSNVQGKHILFYFFNQSQQSASEAIDAAGRIQATPNGSDYFALVDANLGGAKSNFFVTQAVEHEIDLPSNGTMKETVTITYKNPFPPSVCDLQKGELCLNSVLQDWVRVYIPSDATLNSTNGFDEGSVHSSQDLNHQVIDGSFRLQPLSSAKLIVSYSVPYSDPRVYKVLVQKQGGTENFTHTFVVNGQSHDVVIDKDQALQFGF